MQADGRTPNALVIVADQHRRELVLAGRVSEDLAASESRSRENVEALTTGRRP